MAAKLPRRLRLLIASTIGSFALTTCAGDAFASSVSLCVPSSTG